MDKVWVAPMDVTTIAQQTELLAQGIPDLYRPVDGP